MSTEKFTKGPWRVGADLVGICTNYRDEKQDITRGGWAKTVAKVTDPAWMQANESIANARLIAAAPQMLDALKHARLIATTREAAAIFDAAISAAVGASCP